MLNLSQLSRLTGQKLIFPFYHVVSDGSPKHIKYLYHVKTVSEFTKDLDQLLRDFEVLSPEYLIGHAMSIPEKPSMILSFDDGLSEVYDVIYPVLQKKGIPALFFLNNSFIDNRDLFYRFKSSLLVEQLMSFNRDKIYIDQISNLLGIPHSSNREVYRQIMNISWQNKVLLNKIASIIEFDFNDFLREKKPYLSTVQIKKLIHEGYFFGAHSYDHAHFPDLSDKEQIHEIKRSVYDLKERFSVPYTFFAFPFYDLGIGEEVFDEIYKDQELKLNASFGTSGLKKYEKYPHFQRIPVEKGKNSASSYIYREFFLYFLKELAGRNKIKRSS